MGLELFYTRLARTTHGSVRDEPTTSIPSMLRTVLQKTCHAGSLTVRAHAKITKPTWQLFHGFWAVWVDLSQLFPFFLACQEKVCVFDRFSFLACQEKVCVFDRFWCLRSLLQLFLFFLACQEKVCVFDRFFSIAFRQATTKRITPQTPLSSAQG